SSGTAHVIRLFDIPVQLRRFLSLARADKPGKKPAPTSEPLKQLDEVIARVDKVIATLRDPAKTNFHIVALAEPVPEAQTRLIFFVGQGGVGKSSCAAAAAVTLTEKEGPVLLISTDPAHSLSDVLQSRLTDTETQVKGTKGLYARELDVAGWFASLKKRLREKAEKVFGVVDAKSDPKSEIAYDREVLRNLMDSAPAGIDELAALSALTDALVQE